MQICKDVAHRFRFGRGHVFHLAADRRPENADRGERARVDDAIDAALGRLDRLDARDDLARHAPTAEFLCGVFHRLEERALTNRLSLSWTEAPKRLRILEFVTE